MKLISIFISLLIPITCFSYPVAGAYEEYLFGDYHQALRKAKSLRENDESLYLTGLIHFKIGEYEKAKPFFRKAIKKYPRSKVYDSALLKLADCYFLDGEYPQAKKLYNDILEKDPSFRYLPIVYLRLAQVASKQGSWNDKAKYLRKLKSNFPNCQEAGYAKILESYGNYFTVQVGAFSTLKNAQTIKDELSSKYPVYIVETPRRKFTLYKVRIGKYNSRSEAERVFIRLLEDGYPARILP
jgi:tetratricopeptide (TPR) repeat protein